MTCHEFYSAESAIFPRVGICATTVCWLLLGFALPSLAAEADAFRLTKQIDRSAAGKETILGVTFNSDVYAATRNGFPDVRIFDAQDRETPLLVELATERRTRVVRVSCGSNVASLKELEDGLDVVVRLDDKAPSADGLTIFTPLNNYERRVRVSGSSDGVKWTSLVADGLVFDYARYIDVGNSEVRLPKNDCRQYKISIAGIADAKESPFVAMTRKYRKGEESERIEQTMLEHRPFRMDRIEMWRDKQETLSESPRRADYKVAEWRVEQEPANKATLVYVTMRREPLTEFALETSNRNFSRTAVVQKRVQHGVRADWIDIGQGAVSLVALGDYRKQSLDVAFPEQRQTDYRIVIHNEDNPPIAITGVKARGNVYLAVFLAVADENYRLAYGSDQAQPPKYDAATVLAPLRQGHAATEGRLGDERANEAVVECQVCPIRGLLNNRIFLGVVVVVLVVVLGWALFRAAQRINEIPK